MDEIKVMEKPEWISWDNIHELIYAAHKKNIAKGFTMNTALESGEQLKKRLGDDGKCFVALCGDKLVGTTSVSFFTGRAWYNKGLLVAHSMLSAILPKYQGLGILGDLNALRDAYIHEKGAKMLHGDTAEDNKIVRLSAKKGGCYEVSYYAPKADHYSVNFVKWFDGCPYSKSIIEKKCRWSEKLTKLQYKPGKIERSVFLTLYCKIARKILNV